MIEAALAIGGAVGGASPNDLARLRKIGRQLGLAFQIIDDVRAATADTRTLGKPAGKDAKADKATRVKLLGIAAHLMPPGNTASKLSPLSPACRDLAGF